MPGPTLTFSEVSINDTPPVSTFPIRPPTIAELEAPFHTEKLVQVRTGKVKACLAPGLSSAIYKIPHKDAVQVTKTGLVGDEQQFYSHGGIEKALMHYCSRHYPTWQSELPGSEHLFSVGGFGENLVSSSMNERNVCIGDELAIGEIVVQVCEPRQPCYKLNHRFQVKDMSSRSQSKFRTGWYYRVLKEGRIKAGDEIKLLKRVHPTWTVARVQYYLVIDLKNVEAMMEIVEQLTELGSEIREIFQNRLNKKFEDQGLRMFGGGTADDFNTWTDFRVASKKMETPKVVAFILEAVEPTDKPTDVLPGSHVRLKLGGKLVRAYSVVGGNTNRFELGIALDTQSRGGSKFLHEKAKEGDILTAGQITASFPLAESADNHILFAGGIGITAFTAALQYLEKTNQNYELHYAVSSDVPFERYIKPLGSNASIYNKSKGKVVDIPKVLARGRDTTHVYCCGPQRLTGGVEEAAARLGIPKENVHFEAFQVATSGDPFTAELVTSKKTIEVQGHQTLLDALRDAGLEVCSSCEVGNCGTCRVEVCGGRIEHRGTGIMDSEKESAMLSCVSRGIGHISLDI